MPKTGKNKENAKKEMTQFAVIGLGQIGRAHV